MIDLDYDPASLCGPVDLRVARFLQEYRGNALDEAYLEHARRWHGGIPRKAYFRAEDGKTYQIGRFLTLVDDDSPLEPPARPSWEFPPRDIRIDWSVLTLIDQEGPSCRNLFAGERLLPFAALCWGGLHPDHMSLTEGDTDLLAFFYQPGWSRPAVVVWLAHAAQEESFRREAAGRDEVRYSDFTVPVAPNFDAFLLLLRSSPGEASSDGTARPGLQ